VKLTLQPLDPKDPSPSIVPIQTTVRNLSPYTIIPPDTAKTDSARAVNDKLSAYNNKVKFFNSHLTEIQTLFKELDQTDNDLEKLSHNNPDKAFTSTVNSPGLLKEIEVNSQVARKE
jgi:hypothetical protein